MFRLEITGVRAKVEVVSLQGVERISQPYEFQIEVSSRSSTLARQVGSKATLTIDVRGVKTHRHGIIHRVSLIGVDGSKVRYQLLLAPSLAQLELRSNCRIFQGRTVPEVIETVLDEHNIESGTALSETYLPQDYVVQYRETDLEFIERLMEHEGMFYFFKHTGSSDTLTLGDTPTAYEPLVGRSSTLQHEPGLDAKESVSDFSLSTIADIDSVRLRDFNYEIPAANLDVSKKVPRSPGTSELYDYPGGYGAHTEGQTHVRRRFEAERVGAQSASATTTSPRLAPGFTFELAGHPYRPANAAYVALEIDHYGEQDPTGRSITYQNDAYCIDAATPYRSTSRYPALLMQGPQTATVVGPVGQEIDVDVHGRVKVQFHWDRDGQSDENSSAWIRVAQVAAGKGWGSLAIPRVGHEVLVAFIDGDPHRPVIVGSLYNGSNRPPYSLPDGKTKTGIRTQSTPGGGGSNELVFEDKAGEEQVLLRAQKDLALVVANDSTQSVGNDLLLAIGHNLTQSVDNNVSVEAGRDYTNIVRNDHVVESDKDFTHTIGSDYSCTVDAKATISAKTLTLQAVDQITLQVGTASLVMKKNGDIKIGGKKVDINASGPLTMKGSNIN